MFKFHGEKKIVTKLKKRLTPVEDVQPSQRRKVEQDITVVSDEDITRCSP